MDDINFFDIIENVPSNDDEIARYFERKMRMAERDLLYDPEEFISGLTKEIKKQKEEKIKDAEHHRSDLVHDIKTVGEISDDFNYHREYYHRDVRFKDGTEVYIRKAISYDEYHKRETEQRITRCKSRLERVNSDENNFLTKHRYLQSTIDDLQGRINDSKSGRLPPLTRALSEEEQRFLYKELREKEFIGKDEDYQNFRFAFGRTPLMGGGFKKIKWRVRNKQCLRDLLSEIRFNKEADMLKAAELYFLDKNGQEMKLPQNSKREKRDDGGLFNGNLISINEILEQFKKL